MKKQKDGRYKSKVVVGHKENGDPIIKYASGRTKKELEQNKAELKRLYITGNTESALREIPFRVFADEWFKTRKEPKPRQSGKSMHKTNVYFHLIPEFGDRQLRAITAEDIELYLTRIAPNYKKSTIRHIQQTLKQIFSLATARHIIDRNPMWTVEAPPNAQPPKARRALTEAETAAALHVARTHPYGLLWMLLYYTGARVGEVLGLRWEDIDFKKGELWIRRDIDYKKKGDQADLLKNEEKSERVIPIADELLAALKQRRAVYGYVLKAPEGEGYLPQSTYQRHVDALRRAMYEFDSSIEHVDSPRYKMGKKARDKKNAALGKKQRQFKTERTAPQVSVITPHYFRHNFATLCYYSGVDVLTAAAWLGHTDPTMILKVYAHLDKTKARDPEKFNNIFGAR